MASFGFHGGNTAFGTAVAEAVQESRVLRLLPPVVLTSLCQAPVQRVTFAAPCSPKKKKKRHDVVFVKGYANGEWSK